MKLRFNKYTRIINRTAVIIVALNLIAIYVYLFGTDYAYSILDRLLNTNSDNLAGDASHILLIFLTVLGSIIYLVSRILSPVHPSTLSGVRYAENELSVIIVNDAYRQLVIPLTVVKEGVINIAGKCSECINSSTHIDTILDRITPMISRINNVTRQVSINSAMHDVTPMSIMTIAVNAIEYCNVIYVNSKCVIDSVPSDSHRDKYCNTLHNTTINNVIIAMLKTSILNGSTNIFVTTSIIKNKLELMIVDNAHYFNNNNCGITNKRTHFCIDTNEVGVNTGNTLCKLLLKSGGGDLIVSNTVGRGTITKLILPICTKKELRNESRC